MSVTEPAVRGAVGKRRSAYDVLVCAIFLLSTLGAATVRAQASIGPAPRPAPSAWMGLIGEYGDGDRMLISERDGSLYATVEWLTPYPVRQISADVFQWPHEGLYGGSRVTFQRGANGRATQLAVGGIVFPRRQIGPESGTQLRVTPVRPIAELRTIALAATPPVEPPSARRPDLVELTTLDSTIKLEIRYATTNNFLGSRMYTQARAFMQRPAAEAVVRASRELHKRGYGLLIHDAYRPWYVTKIFWDATPADKKWLVANPAHGSMHNRGCAVDLTL